MWYIGENMRNIKKKKCYPLDSSALIHLASMSKSYANTFRLTVELKEKVNPVILQNALHNITERFPTIVAGIKRGLFRYHVVPVQKVPKVKKDNECLEYMSKEMIKKCAIRVLYSEYEISVEFFHSITDGHGGMIFLKSLVAEYLTLRYSISIPYSNKILDSSEQSQEFEIVDDYVTYKGQRAVSVKNKNTYHPSFNRDTNKVIQNKRIYDTQKILDKAHFFGTSITVFLTSVMAKALLELQKEEMNKVSKRKEPVQIMVPINLRRKFPSRTLRNFSLYALPCIMPKEEEIPFDDLIKMISTQVKEQLPKERLKGVMKTNVKSQNLLIFKLLPTPIKDVLLRLIFHFFGERNSCMTISNLGEIAVPDEMKAYIEDVDLWLTPRKLMPYNCSVVSFDGTLHINFTRKCKEDVLERKFYEILNDILM